MRKYKIKKGRSTFKPIACPLPALHPSGFKFKAVLHESCWFSAKDVGGDKDRADWLKLTGITAAFGRNNRRSALIAFRPTDVRNVFALTAYTNDSKGAWQVGAPGIKITTVSAGEEFSGTVLFWQDIITISQTVDYYINTEGGTYTATHDFEQPWHRMYRQISGYWGGANNSPGSYGGAAPKNASYQLEFNWTK